jgi:pimeloyl-ACP methyl ester carboxylesterase
MNGNSSKEWKLLALALALILGGSFLAWASDTVGWTVSVRDVRFVGHDGSLLHARLYVPDGVTEENPAPGVLYIQGNDADADKYSMYSIEFARRGYVVLNMSLRGQGYSDSTQGLAWPPGDTTYFMGGPEGLEYLRSLMIVDSDNIAIMGHSAGSAAVNGAAATYPDGYHAMVLHGGGPPRESDTSFPHNVAVIVGLDDGLRSDPSSLLPFLGLSDVGDIEYGQIYGSIADGTARVVYNVPTVHNGHYFSRTGMVYTIDWLQNTVPAPEEINPSNQIWMWRYVGTTIAFLGAILMMLPVGALLLQTSFFKPLAEKLPEFKGAKGGVWWVGAILTAAIPAAGVFYFTKISTIQIQGLWESRRGSATLGWALICGAITVILLLINHYFLKVDRGATGVNYGLTWEGKGIDWGKIGKSLLLAICILASVYLLLAVIYPWLLVDFRMWNEVLKLVTPPRFVRILKYAPPFALFFIVFGANLHGFLRVKGGSASVVREILTNVAIVAPWYYVWWIWVGPAPSYLVNHLVPFDRGSMYAFTWAFTPIMAAVAVISTYFYRKTGKVYVGAFTCAILIPWLLLTTLN